MFNADTLSYNDDTVYAFYHTDYSSELKTVRMCDKRTRSVCLFYEDADY